MGWFVGGWLFGRLAGSDGHNVIQHKLKLKVEVKAELDNNITKNQTCFNFFQLLSAAAIPHHNRSKLIERTKRNN